MGNVSWTCPDCGTTVTARTASELGMKVAAHQDTHNK